jgi:hypothetical protein
VSLARRGAQILSDDAPARPSVGPRHATEVEGLNDNLMIETSQPRAPFAASEAAGDTDQLAAALMAGQFHLP